MRLAGVNSTMQHLLDHELLFTVCLQFLASHDVRKIIDGTCTFGMVDVGKLVSMDEASRKPF